MELISEADIGVRVWRDTKIDIALDALEETLRLEISPLQMANEYVDMTRIFFYRTLGWRITKDQLERSTRLFLQAAESLEKKQSAHPEIEQYAKHVRKKTEILVNQCEFHNITV